MPEISVGQQSYLNSRKKHRRIVCVSRITILLSFLFLWEFTANVGIIDSFIFSSPSKIALCFWGMILDRTIFLHIWTTLYETIVSFILVTVTAVCVAVLLWCSTKLSEILDPYLVVLNSLPKSALAPLLIVWLGATQTTIIVAGMSVAVFGSILNLYTSFTTVDREKVKLIYTLHGNKWHALTKVVLPSSIPAIISNMKVNIGLCLVGVIIGEFLAARSGLGYLIIYSSQVLSCVGEMIFCLSLYLPYRSIRFLPKCFCRFHPLRHFTSLMIVIVYCRIQNIFSLACKQIFTECDFSVIRDCPIFRFNIIILGFQIYN